MTDGNATAEVPAVPKREIGSHVLTCKTDQSVKQVSVEMRDAVIFLIGGAGDQERYYVTGPNNNVDHVRNIIINDFKTLKIGAACKSWSLGYNHFMTEEDLEKNIISKIGNCDTAIYIIGHSLGGWNGARGFRRAMGSYCRAEFNG